MKTDRILLHAHPKTGQHWFLFSLHYYNQLLKGDESKLTFLDLNLYKFRANFPYRTGTVNDAHFIEGMPFLKRSEALWSKWSTLHESFDKVLYLARNPFDVMISFQKWLNEKNLHKFVKDRLQRYITHLKEGIPHADIIIWYEDVKKNISEFRKALLLFYDEIDESVFYKAVEKSSFSSIRTINPKHARDGSVGQYKALMPFKLVDYVRTECKKGGVWKWIKEKI